MQISPILFLLVIIIVVMRNCFCIIQIIYRYIIGLAIDITNHHVILRLYTFYMHIYIYFFNHNLILFICIPQIGYKELHSLLIKIYKVTNGFQCLKIIWEVNIYAYCKFYVVLIRNLMRVFEIWTCLNISIAFSSWLLVQVHFWYSFEFLKNSCPILQPEYIQHIFYEIPNLIFFNLLFSFLRIMNKRKFQTNVFEDVNWDLLFFVSR